MLIRSLAAALALAVAGSATIACAQTAGVISVDGNVALSSLTSLSDGHLKTMADTLEALAATPAVQSADWSAIKEPLRATGALNVPAALFFAKPDGSYWTVDGGKQAGNVKDRAYFSRVMAGSIDIGELVTSRSTGRSVTIVAVPINAGGKIVGLLGASVYLDELSGILSKEMGVGAGVVFWAIDGNGKIAIHSDVTNIFTEPGKMSGPLRKVMNDMLARDSGSDTYVFRGTQRTVIYRKSSLTGWRYGFGVVR